MNLVTIEIIVAIVVWLSFGLPAGGWYFAQMQKADPNRAAEDYQDHTIVFWVTVFFGLVSFIAIGFSVMWMRSFFGMRYDGMLFPWTWRHPEAIEMQRAYRDHPRPIG